MSLEQSNGLGSQSSDQPLVASCSHPFNTWYQCRVSLLVISFSQQVPKNSGVQKWDGGWELIAKSGGVTTPPIDLPLYTFLAKNNYDRRLAQVLA
jgi:hypothetical protein